jgi:hypothetical protein
VIRTTCPMTMAAGVRPRPPSGAGRQKRTLSATTTVGKARAVLKRQDEALTAEGPPGDEEPQRQRDDRDDSGRRQRDLQSRSSASTSSRSREDPLQRLAHLRGNSWTALRRRGRRRAGRHRKPAMSARRPGSEPVVSARAPGGFHPAAVGRHRDQEWGSPAAGLPPGEPRGEAVSARRARWRSVRTRPLLLGEKQVAPFPARIQVLGSGRLAARRQMACSFRWVRSRRRAKRKGPPRRQRG